MNYHIIACSGSKERSPCSARTLYSGQMFRNTLATAERIARAEGGTVLILSARYGLIGVDQLLDPYDVTLGDSEAISPARLVEQVLVLGVEWGDEVYAYLPGAYLDLLVEVLGSFDIFPISVYEGARGIGEQRFVNRTAALV